MSVLPAVGLLQACDDSQLFGIDLWPTQRTLLEAVERGPRLHVWCLGRRSAKTTSAAIVGLWDCLFRPELARFVLPGERRHSVCVATNLRQARLFVQQARAVVERSTLLAPLLEHATEDELFFGNGTALSAFACSSRSARGWPISSLLFDEAAHFQSESDGPQTLQRVLEAMLPSSAQFGDSARAIVASTPYGESGAFASLFQQASSGELPDAVAQHFTTAQANPTIDEAFLEREQARDPDSFAAEYLAQFVGSGAAYLDPERVADAVADRSELPPEGIEGAVAGLDPAFSSDPFGLAIVGRDPRDSGRLVLAVARAWKPARRGAAFEERRASEDRVLEEVAAVCKQYRASVVTDQYAAPAIVARLREAGLRIRVLPMGARSKTECFAEVRARLNAGTLDLYDHPELLAELRRLRTRYSAGSASVVNPRVGGSHGDMAQALALAVLEHAGPRSHGWPEGWTPRLEPAFSRGILDKRF